MCDSGGCAGKVEFGVAALDAAPRSMGEYHQYVVTVLGSSRTKTKRRQRILICRIRLVRGSNDRWTRSGRLKPLLMELIRTVACRIYQVVRAI